MVFDYSNIDSGPESVRDFKKYISETLMPPVQSLFEASLKVIPWTGKLYLSPAFCAGLMTIPPVAIDEGYDADIAIFVKAVDEPQAGWIADAFYCAHDMDTMRPIAGAIRFNVASLRKTTEESDLSTTLHEIMHILAFNEPLYPNFINPETLQPLKGHLFKKMVNGIETTVLNVPPLTQRLRKHFNCPTLEGAYLENQGTPGSAGVHLERRIFYNEFMTANDILDLRFSEFTFALLEGSGWYKVDYSYAEPMTYGKNAGCAFLDGKCMNPVTKEANFREFCSPLTSMGVSWTKRGFGSCGRVSITTNPNLTSSFDHWGNKTVVGDPFSDNCPYIQTGLMTDCEIEWNAKNASLGTYEFYGIGGRAFVGNLSRGSAVSVKTEGFCFKTECLKMTDDKYMLQVFFGGDKNYVNCSKKGNIDSSNFNFTHDIVGGLECPDPNEFCGQVLSEGFCKGGCYGNGKCRNRKCECIEGWTSHNCAKREYVDKCSRCANYISKTTCYGNECVCNPSNITCQCALGLKKGAECLNLVKVNNGASKKADNTSMATNKNVGESKKAITSGENLEKHSSAIQTSRYGQREIVFAVGACLVLFVVLACFMKNKKTMKGRETMKKSLVDPMIKNQSQIAEL